MMWQRARIALLAGAFVAAVAVTARGEDAPRKDRSPAPVPAPAAAPASAWQPAPYAPPVAAPAPVGGDSCAPPVAESCAPAFRTVCVTEYVPQNTVETRTVYRTVCTQEA